jgi:23S rRNA (adenine-N6)-dimethyltransferase
MTDCPAYITFQQWLKVFQYYIIGVSDGKKRLVHGSYSRLQDEQKKIDKIHRSRK